MSGEPPELDVFMADGVDSIVCRQCGVVTVNEWTVTSASFPLEWMFPLDCGHDWPEVPSGTWTGNPDIPPSS